MRSKWLPLLFIPVIAVGIILAVYLSQSASASSSSPAEETRIQLAWTHEYSSAPFYTAEYNGHFAAENLRVQLQEGGFGENGYIEPIDEVVEGRVDFAMGNASSLILARAQGKPVVALLAVLQRSPTALVSLAEDNILRPSDLLGHTVAVSDGGATQKYNVLLTSQSLDSAEINTISRTTYGIEPLMTGEADVLMGWLINEGAQVREAGYEPNIMLLSDYGIESYDFLLFTTATMVDERPDLVERVVSAVIHGMEDVVANPTQAIDYVLRYAPDLDREGQQRRLELTIPLMNPAGSSLGMMNPEIWENVQQMMLDEGELTEPMDLSSVYTLEFVQ